MRKLCELMDLPRSSVYREPTERRRYKLDESLVRRIWLIIQSNPYFGLRRIHWKLNQGSEHRVNIKAVHRILKIKGWTKYKRPKGMRPRVQGWKSACEEPNMRWAIDTSHFMTKKDGWCHITAVIDCCDRMIVGWRVSRSAKARVAAAALEDAIVRRNPPVGLVVRSDNGSVFGSEAFTKVASSAGILQEYITPYTPEQNGMIERWFRTLKEERIWLQQFYDLEDARSSIDGFIEEYNQDRPHRSLEMMSPANWNLQISA